MKTALLASTALCLAPFAAFAITPQEAWDSWKALAAESGATLEAGGEQMSGGTLLVTDVRFETQIEDGIMSVVVPGLSFTDVGGGAVETRPTGDLVTLISGIDSDGAISSVGLVVAAPDFSYRVQDGAGGGIEASYGAPVVTVTLDNVTEDGEAQDVTGTASMSELSGAYTVSAADPAEVQSDLTAAAFNFAMSGTDDESGEFSVSMAMTDLATSSASVGSSIFTMMSNPDGLVGMKGSVRSEGSAGSATIDISLRNAPEDFDLSMTMQESRGSAYADANRIEYDVLYNGLAWAASGSEIPFPQVTGSLGQWQTKFGVPVGAAEEAAPVSIVFALRDLAIGEEIWSLFDPGGALPRDPATLVIDLVGQMRVLQDLLAGEFVETQEMPAEIEQVTINEMRLALAGAELSAQGGVALDYDSPSPFGPGAPAADGTVNLMLKGGQALLDTLVQMGLLSNDDAMMARMMTGMLARPGDGPDTLVSEITVRPDGTILANGAPLPF